MKTVKQLNRELTNIRKDLKLFWGLINNKENMNIYVTSAIHGVKLSKNYVKKIMPVNRRLKKFMGL